MKSPLIQNDNMNTATVSKSRAFREEQPSLLFTSETTSAMETFKPVLLFDDTLLLSPSSTTPTRRGGGNRSSRLSKSSIAESKSIHPTTVDASLTQMSESTSPLPPSITQSSQQIRQHAEAQWRRAAAALQTNPHLMTIDLLKLTLQHRPPVHVIAFMLQVLFQQRERADSTTNTANNSISTKSLSLQPRLLELVQASISHDASVGVVELLLQVNPFLLIEHGAELRQLAQRRHRMDLHSLLQQPPSFFWKRSTTTSATSMSPLNPIRETQLVSTAPLTPSSASSAASSLSPSMVQAPLRSRAKKRKVLLSIPEHEPLIVSGRSSSDDGDEWPSVAETNHASKPLPLRGIRRPSKLSWNRHAGSSSANKATSANEMSSALPSNGGDAISEEPPRLGKPLRLVSLSNITNTPPARATTKQAVTPTVMETAPNRPPVGSYPSTGMAGNYKSTSNSPTLHHQDNISLVNREELENVKLLCLAALKGQKRLAQEWALKVNKIQQQVPLVSATSECRQSPDASRPHSERDMDMWLAKCQELQDRQFKTQLIALDMKERAMRAQVHQLERSVLDELKRARAEYQHLLQQQQQQQQQRSKSTMTSVEERTASLTRRLDEWQARSDLQLNKLETRMNHEAQVNSRFRSYHYSQLDKLQRHQQERRDDRDDDATKKTTLDDDDDDDNDGEAHINGHPSWLLEPWLDAKPGAARLDGASKSKKKKKKKKKMVPIIFASPSPGDAPEPSSAAATDCLLQGNVLPNKKHQQQEREWGVTRKLKSTPSGFKSNRKSLSSSRLSSPSWWSRAPPAVKNDPKYLQYKDKNCMSQQVNYQYSDGCGTSAQSE